MMQKRVLAVYFSMMRRRAICAVLVMASASSRMISLKPAIPVREADEPIVKICLVEANVLICSRTTSMPRSSEALSSSTIWRILSAP